MTDFTRLITSLKRRSAHAKEFGDSITFVKLKDIDALVEALEKAQSANAAQDDHINQQQDRIEQLEEGARQINSWRRLAKQNIAEREKDIAELEAARQRIAELESSGIASGILRCTECSFVQTKNIISITPDAIVIGNSKPEPCQNGCGPLQPVTWKALAIQLMFTTKQGGSELLEAKKRIAELEESHAQVIQSRDHYKRISEEGLKQLAEPRTFIVKLPHQAGFDDPQTAYDAIEECKAAIAAAGVTGIMWEVE